MKYFFLILFICQTTFAGLRCENLFSQPKYSAEGYAQSLGLTKNKDFWSKYLWYKYLKKWKTNKRYSVQSFEARIEESYDLIRRMKIRQGLINNKDRDFYAKPEELVVWAEKALMKEGLKGYLMQVPKNQKLHQRAYYTMTKFLQTKFGKFLISTVTWTLPNRLDRELPAELIAKVLIDGTDAHIPELKIAFNLQGQNKIDSYRRIQRAVKYLSLTVTAVWYFHAYTVYTDVQTKQSQASEQQYEQVDGSLEKIEDKIDSGIFDP